MFIPLPASAPMWTFDPADGSSCYDNPHPFHAKLDWNPPVRPSFALETFLEEVKLELAEIHFKKPKPNLTPGEQQAR